MTTEEEKKDNFKKYAMIGVGVVLIVKGSRILARLIVNHEEEKARKAEHDRIMANLDRVKDEILTGSHFPDLLADLRKQSTDPQPEEDPT
jgi:hypothetical protein